MRAHDAPNEDAFSEPELAIAALLESEGATVVRVKRSSEPGVRSPDALVDGIPTEFKSLGPGASSTRVRNVINRARGQAPVLVIDARSSDLTESEARRGLDRGIGAYGRHFERIRIIGDGYDISRSPS